MLLRYSLSAANAADDIERAVSAVLEKGLRTGDIASGENDQQILGTEAMGDAVMAAL